MTVSDALYWSVMREWLVALAGAGGGSGPQGHRCHAHAVLHLGTARREEVEGGLRRRTQGAAGSRAIEQRCRATTTTSSTRDLVRQ